MEPIIPFDLVAMMPAHATNGVDSGQSSPRGADQANARFARFGVPV